MEASITKMTLTYCMIKSCFFLLHNILLLFSHPGRAATTIFPGQYLSANQTIISDAGTFELGFFSPGNSQNYYVGIWYRRIPTQTVVWVANRNHPISDPSSSTLQLSGDGRLVLLLNNSGNQIWSTDHVTSANPNSTIAVLLENGNLIVGEGGNSSNVVNHYWQSFDHPTDTWLPGGKIGYSKLRNETMFLTAWSSPENPAPGIFSSRVKEHRNGPSHDLLWNHSRMFWSSGEWTGKNFVDVPEIVRDYYIKNFQYEESEENESFFTYDAALPLFNTRFQLDYTGQLKQFVWGPDFQRWTLLWTRPTLQCEVYGFCGGFAVCDSQGEPLCECLQGFEPAEVKDWELDDHSDGCVRKTPLQCWNDTFFTISDVDFPEGFVNLTIAASEEACRSACLSECSCTAYTDHGGGCSIWKGGLFNLQKFRDGNGEGKDFHVRISGSDQAVETGKKKSNTYTATLILIGTIAGFIPLVIIIIIIIRGRKQRLTLMVSTQVGEEHLVVFKYRDLQTATKNFSEKLGEGGCGSVYRGRLLLQPNSATTIAIAVKKLNHLVKEDKQFRAEVRSLATIQHINLVRLRGCCAESSRRCLVFDYMPNGSLDFHLFRRDCKALDWKTRYGIAMGTARALAYLHERCRDCIIHCDIKPENILLDAEYHPKVTDFGLAKLMGRDFSRVLTTMRGTRGYLAPEWLSGEAITPKVDVFSYGMVLLEIVSGRRNMDLIDVGIEQYFPSRAAHIVSSSMNHGGAFSLLDNRLEGIADMEEVSRACKVACWCIQDDEKERPTMGQIVHFLEGVSEVGTPPIPRFLRRLPEDGGLYIYN